ncbi:hypothetical protein BJV82DRAFT_637675 [Fennellomyces sp. T-0311]|nr:hypothetical protein BJV82DRAFT_637675 [Fennellomyces sp. T-0311]
MSYISSLNLLGTETPPDISEEALTEELSLWANAQFTFDTEPGSALLDDLTKEASKPKSEDLFATLTEFGQQTASSGSYQPPLSYILPQPSQQHLPRIAPAPVHMDGNWTTTPTLSQPPASRKRKQSAPPETDGSEKIMAEEDKRRRNTAASARFRMKKKMREQALEQTAKEMTVKADELEKRVKELEMEAKWLRALVIEKDPKLLDLVESDKPTNATSSSS